MIRTRILVPLAALAITLAALAAPAAAGRKVFLNGVDLSDTRIADKTFSGCTVRFDADGNVHITAEGVKIERQPAPDQTPTETRPAPGTARKKPAPPAKLSKSYFLITKESPAGATDFDIAVEINGREAVTIRSGDASANGAIDVTQYVKPGENQIRMTANKRKTRHSRSAQHQLTIMLGEGSIKNDTVTVTRTVLEYRRTAAETQNAAASYRFDAR